MPWAQSPVTRGSDQVALDGVTSRVMGGDARLVWRGSCWRNQRLGARQFAAGP